MTQKILIYRDKSGIATFIKDVQQTCEDCNALINLFNSFQPWTSITELSQFEELAADPGKYFDDTILLNIHVTARGLKADPAQAAKLFNISRDQYLNLCAGLALTDSDCPECARVKIKPGKQAVSRREYQAVAEYLIFAAGAFTVDMDKVNGSLDRFNVYAETPEQIALYKHFTGLVDYLNYHTAKYPINPTDRQTIAKSLHLQLTEAIAGSFRLNDEFLKNEIIYLKTKK